MTPTDLARLGLGVADLMERAGSPTSAGIVRQLAALVIDQAAQLHALRPAAANTCPVCGTVVIQPATGRPRVYCAAKCRKAAHRGVTGRNESMVA